LLGFFAGKLYQFGLPQLLPHMASSRRYPRLVHGRLSLLHGFPCDHSEPRLPFLIRNGAQRVFFWTLFFFRVSGPHGHKRRHYSYPPPLLTPVSSPPNFFPTFFCTLTRPPGLPAFPFLQYPFPRQCNSCLRVYLTTSFFPLHLTSSKSAAYLSIHGVPAPLLSSPGSSPPPGLYLQG